MTEVTINKALALNGTVSGAKEQKIITPVKPDTLITYEDYKNDNEAFNAYEAGDYQRAARIYQQLAVQTGWAAFYYNWGVSLQESAAKVKDQPTRVKLLLEVEEIYKKALKIEPQHLKTHNNLGIIYYTLAKLNNEQSYLTAARRQYALAIETDHGYGKAHYNLGLLEFETGNSAGVTSHLPRAVEDTQLDKMSKAKSFYFLGVNYFEKKDHAGALEHFEKALELGLSKDFRKIQYYWRAVHDLLGLPEKNQDKYKIANKDNPKDLLAADNSGDSLEKNSEYGQKKVSSTEESKLHIENSQKDQGAVLKNIKRELDPAFLESSTPAELYSFGTEAYAQKKYSRAIVFFNKALQKGYNKKDKNFWAMLGMSYSALKEYRQAIAALTSAINFGYKDEVIYLHRAALYYQTSESSKAIADLQKCKSQDAYWHYWFAMASAELKDLQTAEEHFNEAIRLKPDFRSAYNGRGLMYWRQGRRELAEKDFDIAFPGRRK